MNNKLLKGIEYLFYLMILFYLVGKSFEILTILIDILFIIFLFKNKNIAIDFYKNYKKLINAFGILLSYFLIQSLFTNDIVISLKHSFGMIRFIILLFAIVYVFNSKEKIKNVMIVSFISLFIVNFDSLYQYIFKIDLFGVPMYNIDQRITAWSDSPVVSLYSGMFFGFLISSFFILEGKYKKISFISIIFFIIIFMLSGNRSPIVAMLSTLFILGFIIEKNYRKYVSYVFLGIIILFFTSFLSPKLKNAYINVFNPTNNNAISGRSQIYSTSIDIIEDNLLIGIGSGMFRYRFKNYYIKNYDANSLDYREHKYLNNPPYHSHNILLDILVSYGILGLIVFAYLFSIIYKNYIRYNFITVLSSIGFIYCITPFQFAKSMSQSNWQFYTFLGLIFLLLVYNNEKLNNIDISSLKNK